MLNHHLLLQKTFVEGIGAPSQTNAALRISQQTKKANYFWMDKVLDKP